ncbi:uncharacterized protein LOC128558753 [Mercenaria mercenaria]|uniref:uncharacterized protein LOC128558753 n=1 Tax=Mercenaria mercenaria TaxID=6596 RepID=UPI00234F368B|nr:uncharacterized protein LOC128558753 [Mercenaria mercenaria]
MRNPLSEQLHNWENIYTSSTILEWIADGVKFPFTSECASFELPNRQFNLKEIDFIKKEIADLLLLGCIEQCDVKPFCVSPINCVPKKNGTFRLITDLREVNKFSTPPKFKYEDIETVKKCILPSDYMHGRTASQSQHLICRNRQLASRHVIAPSLNVRVDAPPKIISVDRPDMGTSHDRSFWVHDDHSTSNLQFLILGSANVGRRCTRSKGLELAQQLRERSICFTSENINTFDRSTSRGYSNSTLVARSAMVQSFEKNVSDQSDTFGAFKQNCDSCWTESRTAKEPNVETLRVETIWSTRLRVLGWQSTVAKTVSFSIAPTTLKTYNKCINQYVQFCRQHHVDFSDNTNTATLAKFLYEQAIKTERPESSLNLTSAAITFLFEALGKSSPMHNPDIRRLIVGLVKTGTKKPMKRNSPMPIQPFVDLFHKWGDNASLTLKQLRQKTLTIMAFTFMARPSDLAPRSEILNSDSSSLESIVLSLTDVTFEEDGHLTINFWGIKNDTNRQGFRVSVPSNSDTLMDLATCLQEYVTHHDILGPNSALRHLRKHRLKLRHKKNGGRYHVFAAINAFLVFNNTLPCHKKKMK